MKRKKQILEKIKNTREFRDYPFVETPESKRLRRMVSNVVIEVLRGVLGYKTAQYYWCSGCTLAHKGKRCPRCGGD